MFVHFIGETETWVCFGFCVCLSMDRRRSRCHERTLGQLEVERNLINLVALWGRWR